MRIGIDCRLWKESGVGRYTRNLVSELSKLDTKNQYILFFKSKEFKEVALSGKNFEKRLADIPWHSFVEQRQFAPLLDKENLDLIHFPYISVPLNYKKPFVMTIHDLILFHYQTAQASTLPFPIYNLKLLGYKHVVSQAAKNAKKIITVSNFSKKDIMDQLRIDPDKIVVTYEGSLQNEKTKKQTQKENYFLYVGNAYPHKNLELLVQAFSKVVLEQPETAKKPIVNPIVKLVFVGKDDMFYKGLKEKVKDLNIEKSVEFKNDVTDEELLKLYQNSLAFITPSKMEGFGLGVLEAITNNCFVIASDIPTFHEICEEAALYFDPMSVDDLVDKMKLVLYGNTFQDKIELGFQRAKEFSWKKMAEQTLQVYQQVLEK